MAQNGSPAVQTPPHATPARADGPLSPDLLRKMDAYWRDADFDVLFTRDRPVIFAYHGYPWLIHR